MKKKEALNIKSNFAINNDFFNDSDSKKFYINLFK